MFIKNTVKNLYLHEVYITMIVEGVLGIGESELRPFQWTCVSLAVPRGTLQIRVQFVRQRSDLTLEQTSIYFYPKYVSTTSTSFAFHSLRKIVTLLKYSVFFSIDAYLLDCIPF